MAVTFTTDSIFAVDAEAIVNPVNCVGVSGAGLALEFARRFPETTGSTEKPAVKTGYARGVGLITETGQESHDTSSTSPLSVTGESRAAWRT